MSSKKHRRSKPTADTKTVAPTPEKKEKSLSFFPFIFRNKSNRIYFFTGIGLGLVYFILLRVLFPYPSFYYDSFTYVQAARDNYAVSFRPIGYSDFISFFHSFSTSDFALIFAQYLLNVVANLFAFFTFLYFFPLPKAARWLLFVLLICNPIYLFYSNYVLSDSFFCSLTVIWFALLVWIAKRPWWVYMVLHVIILLLLFKLRYNAIIYPVIFFIVLLLSRQTWLKSLGLLAVNGVFLFLMMQTIAAKNEASTGERIFAPFSGWQLANNAMHILKYKTVDTSDLNDDERVIHRLIKNYLDTIPVKENMASADYMWNVKSPLKQYVNVFAQKYGYQNYFRAWTALGPVYDDFGKKIILQKPFAYFNYFVWPNIKQYYEPQMEAYLHYNENRDTVAAIARDYFHYPNKKISLANASINDGVFKFSKIFFEVLNYGFLLLLVLYGALSVFRNSSRFFNQIVVSFTLFYFGNLFFIAAVAPNAFRYHVFILTLLCIFCVYLTNNIIQFFKARNTANEKHSSNPIQNRAEEKFIRQ